MTVYWGHSENGDRAGPRELLRTHIDCVASRTACFAAAFDAEDQGRVAGLLHDLGKYADQYQRRLSDPQERGLDHSSAGARFAALACQRLGVVPSLAVEGHHIGLTQIEPFKALAERIRRRMEQSPEDFTSTDMAELFARFRADGFEIPSVSQGLRLSELAAADMLDVRMLFSTLVDADFLATEEHFAGDATSPRRPRPDGPTLDAAKALRAVSAKIEAVQRGSEIDPNVREMRENLANACLNAAELPTGLFTLSAPTGSGKTLAMLRFALRHAIKHQLRRVVLVMPFLNIIEQTAAIYRELFSPEHGFPDHFVIEDHSNVQPPERNGVPLSEPVDATADRARLSRLLAENWDSPIVLTTSVQCLESLMANRPSACRKLHRLADSVILFDEVQTLPPHLAVPTLATLSRLCERFGASVLFATATQPAFDHLDSEVRKLAVVGWTPHEITTDIQERQFAVAATRVRVSWRTDEPTAWDKIADELASQTQVLCIVNLKRHASELARMLADRGAAGVCHLSTNMCPAHRADVLACAILGLKSGRAVQLVATQCVEAGVDIDFPVVYRALGPLEAVAQAAGRCNRHGARPAPGVVRVFVPESDGKRQYPAGAYQQAADSTTTFLRGLAESADVLDRMEILNDPQRLRAYYRQFYALTRAADVRRELDEALTGGDFAEVARHYRLIEANTINIVVPYDRPVFETLRAEAEHGVGSIESIRSWIRRARPHAVSPYRPKRDAAIWNHLQPVQFSRRERVDNDEAEWFVALPELRYDTILGLIEPEQDILIS